MANDFRYFRKMIWNGVRIGIIIIMMTNLYECGEIKKPEEKEKYVIPDSLLKTLVLDTVQKCPLVNTLKLTGMVDFNQDNQVNIYSLVSGNIQNISVQLGDYVKKGEILAIVKSGEMAG